MLLTASLQMAADYGIPLLSLTFVDLETAQMTVATGSSTGPVELTIAGNVIRCVPAN